MLNLFFLASLINDTYSYALNPNNTGEIAFQVILALVSLIIPFLAIIFWKPIRILFLTILRWVDMHRLNPNLDMEIIISGEIPKLTPHDFVSKMSDSLRSFSDSGVTTNAGDSFRFSKNFGSFGGNITISPGISSQTDLYDFLFIRVRTKDIKLKKVKEGINEVQLYLFGVVGAINQRLNFKANNDNECVSFALNESPKIFNSIKGLNIDNMNASDDNISVTFFEDKISFTGRIEPPTIEKIENIVRANLST